MEIEGGEAFLVNWGQTTDATRWHKLILGLKADELKMALADMPVVDLP